MVPKSTPTTNLSLVGPPISGTLVMSTVALLPGLNVYGILLPRFGNVWLIVVLRGVERGACVDGSGRSRRCRVGQTAGLNPTKMHRGIMDV